MVVFLMYEHLVREWCALQKLKKSLEEKNACVYVFSIIFERTKAIKVARIVKPDILVLPWFVDGEHEKIIFPFLKKNPNLKVINMHHEEIGDVATDDVFFPKTDYTRNGCYHFSWGVFFEEKLIQHGVDPKRIKVTGNIRNDSAYCAKIDRNELAKLYNLDQKRPWILFADSRGYYIQRVTDKVRLEFNSQGMSSEYIDLKKEYEKNSLNAFVDEMNKWENSKRDKFEFIYRPHPGVEAPKNMPKWIHVICDLSIYEWINACDLFLTSGSTSIFEAEICRKPCAIFESIDVPESLRVFGLDEYPQIHRVDEIDEKLIDRLIENSTKELKYVKYLGKVDGKAIERTVNAIIEIFNDGLEDENRRLAKFICKPSWKELCRHWIYEKVTYFMTVTKLLYVFKYPRSAYGELRDIPYSKEAKWIHKK